ncbi:MAG: hypothetical protein CVU64_18085 [Deltaproteobacteria bacterium HGW-Deltaproteobacteria-21]|nr:MAG: hypothetical protein CVU64_18085 [Deltaproteobacteria bacterium HGW-Deltaproteobacteria-21]
MILNPAIIALLGGSLLVSGLALYASWIGIRVIRHWDLRSGSEQQLLLERKTYLVSTIFSYLLVFEFLSLFLFIYTAEHIHDLFVGAMCAAGSLDANGYGYVTLLAKMLTFLLCGVWMILNYTDNKGSDYPLIRHKYKLLLSVTGALVLETWLQYRYFTGLRADVITSCCGTLFSVDTDSIAGDLASLPSYGTKIGFYLGVAMAVRAGIHFLATGRAAGLFSLLAAVASFLSMAAVVSFVSVHYYELPTHHCPFCLLQGEYRFIGYPLYLSLLLAAVTGVGVGAVERVKGPASLQAVIPGFQKKLALVSMAAFLVFTALATYPMVFSNFVLEGY